MIQFIRFGGLSSVPQKLNYRKEGFHNAPASKGNYCFIQGFMEMFLVEWKLFSKDKIKNLEKPRHFKYEGKIWTHIFVEDSQINYYRIKGSWYETDTKSLEIIIYKYKHLLNKEAKNPKWKKNDWKIFAKDEWEVFIEKI